MQRSVPCPSSRRCSSARKCRSSAVNIVNIRFRSGRSGNQPAKDRDARFEVVDALPVEADEGDRRDHQQQDCRDDETAASIRFVRSASSGFRDGPWRVSLKNVRTAVSSRADGSARRFHYRFKSTRVMVTVRDASTKTEDRWPPPIAYARRSTRRRCAAARPALRLRSASICWCCSRCSPPARFR